MCQCLSITFPMQLQFKKEKKNGIDLHETPNIKTLNKYTQNKEKYFKFSITKYQSLICWKVFELILERELFFFLG